MEKHIDKDCIFCKLANGEIPTTSIYEDEDFNVIMDLGPASRGHSIILPKTHAANLYELPDDYCSKIMGLYVEPNKARKGNAKYSQNGQFNVSLASTIISALSVLASLGIALLVK